MDVVCVVGMAVVPGDEVGGGVAARQVLPWDAERVAAARADRVHDDVVPVQQVGGRHVLDESDAAGEAERAVRGDLVEHPRDRLDLRMIRCHACANQAERRGEGIEEVDREVPIQKHSGGVEA